MKPTKLFLTLAVAVLLGACSPKIDAEKFLIEGRLRNVPDSTIIVLLEDMGGLSEEIAIDTIMNGKFKLTGRTKEEGVRCANIIMHSPKQDFTCMSVGILYISSGVQITIDGKTENYAEWRIRSNVPAQKTMNLLLEQARDEYSLYHQLTVEHYPIQQRLFDEHTRSLPITEQNQIRTHLERIRYRMDSVNNLICRKSLNLMNRLPIDEAWLHQMRSITWCEDLQVQKAAKKLCQRMDASHKGTTDGQYIMNKFFPERQVSVGDMVPDIALKDTLGHQHRLQELQGKYLLLDFWRYGCQPCMMSIPEMRKIAEQMKDSVTVVSISPDPVDIWKQSTIEHGISWHNWNDMQGDNGIFSRYNIKGYPTYFIVSPEGKLIAEQGGYSKGVLLKFLEETIAKHKKTNNQPQ